jgi:tRNA(adenine34) deaminase
VNDEELMRAALAVAQQASASGDVPVGAVIGNSAGEVIATGHNERERTNDPTAHAEIVAIRKAAQAVGEWR